MTSADDDNLLADADRSGVYHLPQVSEQLLRSATAQGFVVYHVDLARARDKGDMLEAIGKAMGFPEWFGYNFDALADSLSDLGWRPALGYVVILEHCAAIRSRAEPDFALALRIFGTAADEWRDRGIPFWCFLDLPADGIASLPP